MQNETELELSEQVQQEQIETPAVEQTPAQEAAAPVVEEKPKKVKKVRHRPWPLKILLGLVAFVLCIAMFGVTLAGAVVVDLRVMTSEGGIKEVLTQLFLPTSPAASDRLSLGMTMTAASPVPGTAAGEGAEMSNFLLDAAFDILQQQFGDDVPLTKEQVGNFLEQSTAKDFLAEKVAGVVDDLLNDTSNTTITRDEIMTLVKDNKQLIEQTFEVTIDDSMLDEMEKALEEVEIFDEFEEKGLMGIVTESLGGGNAGSENVGGDNAAGAPDGSGAAGNPMVEKMNMVKEIIEVIRLVMSDTALYSVIGAFVVLFLLVFLVNFSLPKTLSDTGIVLTFAGLILSAPNFLMISGLLHTALPAEASGVMSMAGGLLAAVQVVHFSILGAGVALIVLAIVAKILKNARLKKAMA